MITYDYRWSVTSCNFASTIVRNPMQNILRDLLETLSMVFTGANGSGCIVGHSGKVSHHNLLPTHGEGDLPPELSTHLSGWNEILDNSSGCLSASRQGTSHARESGETFIDPSQLLHMVHV
jgi:hypothetical protein